MSLHKCKSHSGQQYMSSFINIMYGADASIKAALTAVHIPIFFLLCVYSTLFSRSHSVVPSTPSFAWTITWCGKREFLRILSIQIFRWGKLFHEGINIEN